MEVLRPFDNGIASLLRWAIKMKSDRKRSAGDPIAKAAEELVRLAETSPHLLRDVGFRRDPREGTPTREVWRREGLRLAVVWQDAGASARIEAPEERHRVRGAAKMPLMPDVRPLS